MPDLKRTETYQLSSSRQQNLSPTNVQYIIHAIKFIFVTIADYL